VEKNFEMNKLENRNTSVDSKKIERMNVKHEDPFVNKVKKTNKYYRILEDGIANNNLKLVLEVTKLASEGKDVISDPSFYQTALEYVKRKFPSEKGYLSAEDIAQSAAIAGVSDEKLYKDAVDYILTPGLSPLNIEFLTNEAIDSACRVLASISIANSKLEDKPINAGSAFKFALDRISSTYIANEKRQEQKANIMVEIFEQALEAKIEVEVSREMYEKIYNYIKSNSILSKNYKIRTLGEMTVKAIKAPGLSHTKLFTDFIDYAKENGQCNLVRSIKQLLDVHMK